MFLLTVSQGDLIERLTYVCPKNTLRENIALYFRKHLICRMIKFRSYSFGIHKKQIMMTGLVVSKRNNLDPGASSINVC